MKKTIMTLAFFMASIITFVDVYAASFGASASTTSVAPNGTFTVSIGGDAIGRVDLSVSNGILSTSSVWVEQNYQSVTVTAGSSGVVTITASPVVGFSDADANMYNPGPRTVTVSIKAPTTSTPPSTTTPTKPITKPSQTTPKSQNNNLASLEVSVGTLNPSFDSDITEYTINLTKEVKKIEISGKTADAKAKLSGVGEKTLKPGKNTISITVTAENGATKTYTINAYLDETPLIYLDYKDKRVGIVRDLKEISILDFTTEKYTIEEEETLLFRNKDLTLIYGIDEKSEKSFYLFDSQKNTIITKFTPLELNGKTIFVITPESSYEELLVGTSKIEAVPYEVENYYLLETVEEDGQKVKYLYETERNTFVLYDEKLFSPSVCEETTSLAKLFIRAEGFALLFFLVISSYLYKKLKKGGTK